MFVSGNRERQAQKAMKTILTCILLALASATADAATYRALVVLLRNGHTDVYRLDMLPRMEFDGDDMHLQTLATGTLVNYRRADVARFYVEDRRTAVESLPVGQLDIWQTAPYTYCVSGLEASDAIIVSDLGGRLIGGCATRSTSGTTVISLGALPVGMYLIKLGNVRTLKINKTR